MRVIAECGVNWSNLKEAQEMIKQAYYAGAWAVKFQIFNNKIALKAGISHQLVIGKEKAGALLNYGKEVGIPIFFTVMYPEAMDWLFDLGVPFYKIRLADNTNCKLLIRILMTDKPFFISLNKPQDNILGVRTDKALKLFCVPKYPSLLGDYDSYFKMKNHFNGISDHTADSLLLTYALKINFIDYFEKHVKLNNRCLESNWSITFKELKEVLE